MSTDKVPQTSFTLIPPDNGQQSWIFTFGSGQPHDGRFVVIDGSHADARAEMLARFGNRWSFQYPIEDRADLEGRFGMVELPRKYWPEPTEGGAR